MPEGEFVKIDMSKEVKAEIEGLKEENSKLVDEYERVCNEMAKYRRYRNENEILIREKELLKELAKSEAMKRISESEMLKNIYDIGDNY